MGPMRQSSKWRCKDEGPDSPVISGPMDRGRRGRSTALRSTCRESACTQGGHVSCDWREFDINSLP
jgi:hypothetical protein